MTVATAQAIQYLNLAYFGRPADPASLSAWPASGQSLEQIVLRFTATSEYATNTVAPNSVVNANGGRTYNDTNLINTFYQRLFGRLATATEVAGWADALARGAVNYDYLGITILQAGLNLPVGTEMRSVLVAKFDSAQLYTGILYNSPASAAAYSTSAAIQDGIAYNLATTTTTPQTFAQATAAVAEMVSDSGAGGGQTFTLTTNQFNYTGTGGNDTFIGFVNTTANSTDSTFLAADNIDGAGGINTLQLTVAGNGGANNLAPAVTSNIQNIAVRNTSTGVTTVNANNFTGLLVAGSSGTTGVTYDNLAAATVARISGNGSNNNGANTFNYLAAAQSATLDLLGGVFDDANANNAQTVTGAGLTSLTINSVGSANVLQNFALPATLTSATINATTNLTANTGITAGFAANSTLTINGAGAVSLNGALPANLATVNAAANTGGVTTTLNALTTISFTGGSGNERITTGAVLTTGTVNAGAGTDDRLIVANNGDITAASGARYSGFESLQVGNGVTVNVSQLAAGNTFTAARFTNGGTMTNMTAAQAANTTVTAGGNALTFGVAGATNPGTTNTLAITANDGVAAVSTVALGTPTAAGIELLSINAVDNVTVAALTAMADLTSVTLTGGGTYNLTSGALVLNPGFALNASATTGAGVLNLGAAQTRSAGITLGSGGANLAATAIANLGDNITLTGGTNSVKADGVSEVQTITIANASNANTILTVTINGVALNVATPNAQAAQATSDAIVAAFVAARDGGTAAQQAALAGFTFTNAGGTSLVVTITASATFGNIATSTAVQSAANAQTSVVATTTQGAANVAADVIAAGSGADQFFISGGAGNTVANADTITGLNLGGTGAGTTVDTFVFSATAATNAAVVALTNAQQANVTAAANIGAATDRALGATNAAGQVVQFTYGASTYVAVAGDGNGATYDTGVDFLVNITGFTGTLDATDFTFVA